MKPPTTFNSSHKACLPNLNAETIAYEATSRRSHHVAHDASADVTSDAAHNNRSQAWDHPR